MPEMMPLDRGRRLQGKEQVVLFRATGGECAWMSFVDARRTLQEHPTEWSKDPFEGQTDGAPRDPDFVEVERGGVSPIERPSGW